jgi:hypothetical protein
MAKSSTRKKSSKTQVYPELKEMTDIAANYIKHWTEKELLKYNSSVCIPIKNGYRIGLYKILSNNVKMWDVLNGHGDIIHSFDSKVSAVLYTIYTIKRRYKTADRLVHLDTELNKHYMDIMSTRNVMEKCRKNKDYEAYDIRRSRLDSSEKMFEIVKNDISEMHRVAKFNKVWA